MIAVGRCLAFDGFKLFAYRVLFHRDEWQRLALHVYLKRSVLINYWPFALGPLHGRQHRLASHHMLQVAARAIAQADHPPRIVGRLHQVCMTETLNGTILHLHVEVREDGIGRVRLIGTKETLATQDVYMMPVLRASFCQ